MAKSQSNIDASDDRGIDVIKGVYAAKRADFDVFVRKIEDLVTELVASEKVLSVSGRVKDLESFVAKALKTDSEGKNKYRNPVDDITDLVGVRVICYTTSQAEAVCKIINEAFLVQEYIDKSAELKKRRQVGYSSFHFIVKISKDRAALPEYRKFGDFVCEIQVRTILQHAWAEIEHRVQYKQAETDDELYSRFLSLAGLLVIADREFESILDISKQISEKIEKDIPDLEIEISQTAKIPNLEKAGPEGKLLHRIKFMFGAAPSQLMVEGDFGKAEAVYTEFIRIQPKQFSHFFGRARARALMGRTDEALRDLSLALELAPENKNVKEAITRLTPVKDGFHG